MSHDPEAEACLRRAAIFDNGRGALGDKAALVLDHLAAAGYTVTRERSEPGTTWDALVACCMDNYPDDPEHIARRYIEEAEYRKIEGSTDGADRD